MFNKPDVTLTVLQNELWLIKWFIDSIPKISVQRRQAWNAWIPGGFFLVGKIY